MKVIAAIDRNDIDFDSDFQQPSEFSFGKDRELFHASIDLKWVLQRIGDKKLWLNLGKSFLETIKRLYPPYDLLYTYRQSALAIVKSIYKVDKRTSIKVFQDSLLEAQYLSSIIHRPILIYVEDEKVLSSEDAITPNLETLMMRKIFTNHFIEDLINEKFIFFPISSAHPYFQKIIKVAIQQEKVNPVLPFEYPMVITLVPRISAKDYEQCYKQLANEEKASSHRLDVKELLAHSNPLLFLKRKSTIEVDIFSLYRPTAELLSHEQFYRFLKQLFQEFMIKRREELFFNLENFGNTRSGDHEELLQQGTSPSALLSVFNESKSPATLLIKQDLQRYSKED